MDNMSVFENDGTDKTPTVEELLTRLANKDQFIEQLKGENAGLREDLGQRAGAEDLFRKIVEAKPEPVAVTVPTPKEPDPAPVEEPVDLAQKIREELLAQQAREKEQINAKTVIDRLVTLFGDEDKAGQVVAAKAAELGVSVQYLQDVAVKSPKAFFSVVGIDGGSTATPAPRSDVNSAAFKPTETGNSFGTKAYFDKIRRDNPSEYWSPKIQNQIFKAAQEGTYQT